VEAAAGARRPETSETPDSSGDRDRGSHQVVFETRGGLWADGSGTVSAALRAPALGHNRTGSRRGVTMSDSMLAMRTRTAENRGHDGTALVSSWFTEIANHRRARAR